MEKTERNKAIFEAVMDGATCGAVSQTYNLPRSRVWTLVGNYARKYHREVFDVALRDTRLQKGTFRQSQPSLDVLREYAFAMLD